MDLETGEEGPSFIGEDVETSTIRCEPSRPDYTSVKCSDLSKYWKSSCFWAASLDSFHSMTRAWYTMATRQDINSSKAEAAHTLSIEFTVVVLQCFRAYGPFISRVCLPAVALYPCVFLSLHSMLQESHRLCAIFFTSAGSGILNTHMLDAGLCQTRPEHVCESLLASVLAVALTHLLVFVFIFIFILVTISSVVLVQFV